MTPRERLAALLTKHEGVRLKVYDDGTGKPIGPGDTLVGHPTIGIGLALDTRGLTKAQAIRLRDEALDETEHELRIRLPEYAGLSPVRQMALLEMAYQNGVSGLLGFRKMLAALRWEDWPVVGLEMIDSAWARQTGPQRVATLHRMLVGGVWPDGGPT